MTKSKIYNKNIYQFIHSFLLLILLYVVTLYVTDNALLFVENTISQSIKFIANLTVYKPIILKFTEQGATVDFYLSLLYVIFSAIFLNIYLATRAKEKLYLQDFAFNNWHSFSGVIGYHIYEELTPRLHLYSKENYNIYKSDTPKKIFNEFLIEQLSREGARTYFIFMVIFSFVALPLMVIFQIDSSTISIASFELTSILMTYFQIKTIFEMTLIFKAYLNIKNTRG